MKKIIIFVFTCLCATLAFAQSAKLLPATTTALDENFSIVIDVTNTNLANTTSDVFIWGWLKSNNNNFKTNGSWDNSAFEAKLTKIGTNLYEFKFPIKDAQGVILYRNLSEIIGATPGSVTTIGCLAKHKNGSGSPEPKTPDLFFDASPLTFTPKQLRNFPPLVRNKDVVTLYLDTNASDLSNPALKGSKDYKLIVKNEATGEQKEVAVKELQTGVFGASILPTSLFSAAPTSIRYWFQNITHSNLTSDSKVLSFQ